METSTAALPIAPLKLMKESEPPLSIPSPAQRARNLAAACAELALFGFALRTAVEGTAPDLGHLAWMAALPGTLLFAWAVCLPALYILWAARQPKIGMSECAHAAFEALGTSGACLASTAPILWFFSVTAPASRLLPPLAFCMTVLALFAGGAIFGKALRGRGGDLKPLTQAAFVTLVAITFFEFAALANIHWF